MMARILKKLEIEPITNESFQIFLASIKTILKYADGLRELASWKAPVLPNLSKLDQNEIDFIKSEAQKTNLSIEECQIKVQKLIPQEKRKRFAVYYTTNQGTEFMAHVVKKFLQERKKKIVLADPFLGSGLTLTTAIKEVGSQGIKKVWGVEPLSLPALVAYASLLQAMEGRKDDIDVTVGNAFKYKLPKADIILTNPPFTRWKYLDKKYRESLLSLMKLLGYAKYLTRKEASLQTLAMLLCDYVLNDKGLLISVLPASTFYTIYGRGYKSLLKEKYGVYAVVKPISRASFSEDSGFNEVIVVAIKGSTRKSTFFIEMKNGTEKSTANIVMSKQTVSNVSMANVRNLPTFLDNNWLSLFDSGRLGKIIMDVFEQGLKKGSLRFWNEILGKESIIRGVEMYGPEFFFIPNKYWKITEEKNDFIRIQNININKELVIDKQFLVKALRKPSLYSSRIIAEADTFMLSVPPVNIEKLPNDLQKYIEWGKKSGTAKPAINFHKNRWFSHIYKQIQTKEPFGQIFIPDKVDLLFKNRSVFANYTKEKTSASKNFYIIKTKDESASKLLLAWFNSTFFIAILTLLSRKISNTWTRFLENDYLELPLINLNNKGKEKVIESIDNMLNRDLPPLWEQLNKDYRYKLDLSIANFIGIENPEKIIKDLYRNLNSKFGI